MQSGALSPAAVLGKAVHTNVNCRAQGEGGHAMQETTAAPPPGRDPLTTRIGQVCDAVGAFIEYWGFKAIHGRIWALLALRNGPLAQAEIAKTLGVSRAL